jgi:hypothetical protein
MCSVFADERGTGPPTEVTVDFKTLAGTKAGWIRLVLTAHKTTNVRVDIDAPAGEKGETVAVCFEAALKPAGWHVVRKGTQLVVTGLTVDNTSSPIQKLVIYESSLPAPNRPLITATEDIKIERITKGGE